MASSKLIEMGLVVVLATVLFTGVTAQTSSCANVIIGMAPCLNYITGNTSNPSSSCCSQLSSVIQSQPACLCSVLNGGSTAMGIVINQTLALALPRACSVQTPSLDRCNSAGPTTSPTTTPADTPAESPTGSSDTPALSDGPSASDTPAGTGSKTTPTTDGDASDGNITNFPLQLTVVVLVFIASCAASPSIF